MTKYLIVALGGAMGSMLRFWAGGYVSGRLGSRDQHHGLVSDRLYHDGFGRTDAFESELEIPVGGRIPGRV